MINKLLMAAAAILFFVFALLTVTPAEISTAKIVGVWSLKYDSHGRYWFDQIAFTEDGQKCILSFEFNDAGETQTTYWLNNYRIEQDVLITEVIYSTTEFLPKGTVIRDRLLKLDSKVLALVMVEPLFNLQTESHVRLSGVEPEALCKVVQAYADSHGESY